MYLDQNVRTMLDVLLTFRAQIFKNILDRKEKMISLYDKLFSKKPKHDGLGVIFVYRIVRRKTAKSFTRYRFYQFSNKVI